MERYDVAIIGAGIVGTATAWKLARYKIKTVLLEALPDLACGTTKANGGIIHAGYDPKTGTLKAKLNVQGASEYPVLAEQLGFRYKQTGSLVVGFNEQDEQYLKMEYQNGKANGVPDLKIIYGEEIRALEPRINPQATVALHAPTAGVLDPFEAAYAFAENAHQNGVDVYFQFKVTGITRKSDGFVLHSSSGNVEAGMVVNAAGVYSDVVAALAGSQDFTVTPRIGEILVLDKEISNPVRNVIFPIPSPTKGKGIVVIPTVSGNVLVSATARNIEDKENISTSREGLQELLQGGRKLVADISAGQVIREFSGLRAVSSAGEDFNIGPTPGIRGFITAGGIQSPGLASAPAIASLIRDCLAEEGLVLREKPDYNPLRKAGVRFSALSAEEQDRLIKENPDYGQIVCRCEYVTAGEIIDAIKTPLGATTIDGVKRRSRAGMGRCQGGFCQPRILAILSRYLQKPPEQIWLEYADSPVVMGMLKGGCRQ
ncbi:MAG: FAD/NAD(P)-binding oxidoreductase [Firmicutes bacterium HGW-Firmicutes-14]|nr:MAG: FAD/NAD(P)-binding oxidoreductase [Firmicutes bacterium HGW-Firmicutes-14]